jgi:hypothetical protein
MSTKLLSPKRLRQILDGRIRAYRGVGAFCVEYLRRAGEVDYYEKLPRRSFAGRISPYLRPGVEVV